MGAARRQTVGQTLASWRKRARERAFGRVKDLRDFAGEKDLREFEGGKDLRKRRS